MTSYLGTVQIFAFSLTPRGWARCHGQIVPIVNNQALFTLIGTTYGGDGHTTFALPKLPALGPNGPYYCIGLTGAPPQK